MSEEYLVPVLPLRDVVVFPHMAIPLFVGRDKSIAALEAAMAESKEVLLVAQKAAEIEDPGSDDLYGVGRLASILQLLKLPDDTVKVLVEGGSRAKVHALREEEGRLLADCSMMEDGETESTEMDALMRSAISSFESYSKLNRKVPSELL